MANEARLQALERIQRNIDEAGFHIYLIGQGRAPGFAYTIGLRSWLGAELILAGGIIFSVDDLAAILNSLVAQLRERPAWRDAQLTVESLGSFSFRGADSTWANALMLGALDHYDAENVPAIQILPDQTHWTIDIPDMSQPWTAASAPAWRWYDEAWPYAVPPDSVAVTNLDALRGASVTEAYRWEEDEWEIFAGAGPDVPRDEMYVVPLATLVEADESLKILLDLSVGAGVWREPGAEWHVWRQG